jgi:hypothetical protein
MMRTVQFLAILFSLVEIADSALAAAVSCMVPHGEGPTGVLRLAASCKRYRGVVGVR